MKTLTIFTPTYNRAYCLPRLYESLQRQSSKDFIWLVIDDGSKDQTEVQVKEWMKENENNGFLIQYIYKENGGVHTAMRLAYQRADTELIVTVSSDDYMPEGSVEMILRQWKADRSEQYAGIIALNMDKDGSVIGTELPKQKSILVSDFYKKGGKGDKKLIFRTEVLRSYPEIPVFPGEKFCPYSHLYVQMDQEYTFLILNKAVCVVEYRTDGLTKNIKRLRYHNPKGFTYSKRILLQYETSMVRSLKLCIQIIGFSILGGNYHFLKNSVKKPLMIAAFIPGVIYYHILKYQGRTEG